MKGALPLGYARGPGINKARDSPAFPSIFRDRIIENGAIEKEARVSDNEGDADGSRKATALNEGGKLEAIVLQSGRNAGALDAKGKVGLVGIVIIAGDVHGCPAEAGAVGSEGDHERGLTAGSDNVGRLRDDSEVAAVGATDGDVGRTGEGKISIATVVNDEGIVFGSDCRGGVNSHDVESCVVDGGGCRIVIGDQVPATEHLNGCRQEDAGLKRLKECLGNLTGTLRTGGARGTRVFGDHGVNLRLEGG